MAEKPVNSSPDAGLPPLLEVRDLHVRYPVRGGVLGRVVDHVEAVDCVSLTIRPGETMGLVGESGSGKSTLGKAVLRLVPAAGGEILLGGRDVLAMRGAELAGYRRQVQMIFQDPYYSLNPRKKVGAAIVEALKVHGIAHGRAAVEIVRELFDRVSLQTDQLDRYPHEFSGGQRQRVGIARALALKPKLIVADEPVSALDVSVQAQIVNLLLNLQQEFGLAYLFISHDLGVVAQMCHRITVMNRGQLVEQGERRALFENPQKDYTRELIAAVPTIERSRVNS